jgi:hypothetical protein
MPTSVSVQNFVRHFGHYRDAAQSEPVAVLRHGRVTGYFIAARAYKEYYDLKIKYNNAPSGLPEPAYTLTPPGRGGAVLEELLKMAMDGKMPLK